MAILQYSNGIIEDFKAEGLTFTDKELLSILEDYDDIRTLRLVEIPNTWCLWGCSDDSDPIEFNRIATSIIGEEIYSPLIIIHDGELDPSWNLNDTIILHNYNHFKKDVLSFIDEIAESVLNTDRRQNPLDPNEEYEEEYEEESANLMFLKTIGPTRDKKILFEFNQHKQSKDFFKYEHFSQFVLKVQNYWDHFFYENLKIEDNTCVIYADLKMIVTVKDENVNNLMKSFIKYFENDEEYEICSDIKKYHQCWLSYVAKNKKVNLPQAIPEKIKNKDINKSDEKT